jgi:hypothetical protein
MALQEKELGWGVQEQEMKRMVVEVSLYLTLH